MSVKFELSCTVRRFYTRIMLVLVHMGVNSLLLRIEYVNCSIRINIKSQTHIHQFVIDLHNFKL